MFRLSEKTAITVGGTERYHSLDKLKTLCAFLIVCIHAPFPGIFGEYFMVLTRIAVPIFFMISGFFWNTENGNKQIKKLLKLLFISNALYFAFGFVRATGSGVSAYIKTTFTERAFLKFVLLNQSPFAPHLWYLGAITYVQVFFQFTEKMRFKKLLMNLTPLLLIGKYSLVFFQREFPYVIVRNWLFVGIPYFAIGNMIREKMVLIQKYISLWLITCGISIFAIASLLEHYLLISTGLNAQRDHYISTTSLAVMVFFLFLFFIDHRDSFVSKIGREDSTWVYILHYLFTQTSQL